jgi:hypothetical protein
MVMTINTGLGKATYMLHKAGILRSPGHFAQADLGWVHTHLQIPLRELARPLLQLEQEQQGWDQARDS